MPLKSRVKGNQFEALAVELLTKSIKSSHWKRVPGSGAFGTSMHEPTLLGDLVGHVEAFSKPFRVEAKVGYGGATQFALKKEWLDKIVEESERAFAIPLLIGKFSGAREGIKVFIVQDIETFAKLINKVSDLTAEIEELNKRLLGG